VGKLLEQVLDRPHKVGKPPDEARGIEAEGKVGTFQYGMVCYNHIHMEGIWDSPIS
jgi:hypothetical protein